MTVSEPTRVGRRRQPTRVELVLERGRTAPVKNDQTAAQRGDWRATASNDSLIADVTKESTVCVPLEDRWLSCTYGRDCIGLPRIPRYLRSKLGFGNPLVRSNSTFEVLPTIVRQNIFLAIVIFDNFTTIRIV